MDLIRGALALAATSLLSACALPPTGAGAEAQVQRTAHGVVHVSAPDLQTLA